MRYLKKNNVRKAKENASGYYKEHTIAAHADRRMHKKDGESVQIDDGMHNACAYCVPHAQKIGISVQITDSAKIGRYSLMHNPDIRGFSSRGMCRMK